MTAAYRQGFLAKLAEADKAEEKGPWYDRDKPNRNKKLKAFLTERKMVPAEEEKKEAFAIGFINKLAEAGVDTKENLLKLAADDSSWLGRYLAMKGIQGQMAIEKPWKSMGSGVLGGLAVTPLTVPMQLAGLPPALNPIHHTGIAMGQRRITPGSTPEERKKVIKEMIKNTRGMTYGQAAGRGAKRLVGPGAALGAGVGLLGGAATGGYLGGQQSGDIKDVLMGAGLGAGAGLLGGSALGAGIGAGSGALGGMLNRLILGNISPSTAQRASNMYAEHPYATSLPFGDMVGAGIA